MSDDKITILVLMANPVGLSDIKLQKEVRSIQESIDATKYRDRFEVVPAMAVRPGDVLQMLLKHRPHVVHFCGHGAETGEIFLVGEDDKRAPISPERLRDVFDAAPDKVRFVFLNACNTRLQAEAVVEVIDCAVGTNMPIGDRAAIVFAAAFYRALGFGYSIGAAVKQGKAELMLRGIRQEDRIELFAKRGVDSFQVRLAEPETPAAAAATHATPEIETDSTGRVFISYAPSRISETRLIAAAMRDRGIPLCEEALAVDRDFIGGAITNVIGSPGTAGGLLSLTRDAVQSHSVKSVEMPVMMKRAKQGDGFFVVPAKFSDVELGELGVQLASLDLLPYKVSKRRAGTAEAAEIAKLVLTNRIAAIHKKLALDKPLRLELYTRTEAPYKEGTALLMDWTERFTGRFATSEDWDEYLLPALRDIVEIVGAKAPGRTVQADGRPSLPAATALGCSFVQTRDIKIGWWQHTIGRPDELWSLDARREPCGFTVESKPHRPDGVDLAVLVAVTRPVEPAFELSRANIPPFRAIVHVWKTPFDIESIATAGQAADLARRVHEAVREAGSYHQVRRIHLFMAAPAGLAMMIGQLLNTLGPIQTYEHEPTDAVGKYRAAALLNPSD